MTAVAKIPVWMAVPEFVEWCAGVDGKWELVDGEPRAMAPGSLTHGAIQAEAASVLRNHLLTPGSPCRTVLEAGIQPRVQSRHNLRVPDLLVTCAPPSADEYLVDAPVLIVEILSPGNRASIWANVWAYVSIPSVQEITVLRTTRIGADLLRRLPDDGWPDEPEDIGAGDVTLASIALTIDIAAFYRTMHLAVR